MRSIFRGSSWRSSGRDAKLVDGAVAQGLRERVVDEPVLLDEREPREARADDGDMEVVAASGAVDDRDLPGIRKSVSQEVVEAGAHRLGR